MATTDADPVSIILATETTSQNVERLASNFTVHEAYSPEARLKVAAEHGPEIRALIVRGAITVTDEYMGLLPNLSIIAATGVGYEGVALPAARARGITVTHGRGCNSDTVADQAMALMLGAIRRVPHHDAKVRRAEWRDLGNVVPQVSGKKVGILGFGDIGQKIARRCQGFDMEIRYHTRREVPGVAFERAPSLHDLAEGADVLFAVVPGGAATRHIVNADIFRALGPKGYVINVGRGSVVDTQALIEALESGTIAGAGLDVIENEPDVPERLRAHPNAVMSPHIGGMSPEAQLRSNLLLIENLKAHFAGRPVLTPVPEG